MSKKKRPKRKKRRPNSKIPDIKNGIYSKIWQLQFPAEFRIAAPERTVDAMVEPVAVIHAHEQSPTKADTLVTDRMVVEVATCLWYLKTKYFKQDWENKDADEEDPRVRRALGRLNKGIDSLKESGVEIHDPINKRYPQGGENMMKPIQFQPTSGLTFEKVVETVMPVIYLNGRLIQRAEVFVAVPKEAPTTVFEQSEKPLNAETLAYDQGGPTITENMTDTKDVNTTPNVMPDRPDIVVNKLTYDKTAVDQTNEVSPEELEVSQTNAPNPNEAYHEQGKLPSTGDLNSEKKVDSSVTNLNEKKESNK